MEVVVHPGGWAMTAGRLMRVALGKGGVLALKQEGDGATPAGIWHPRTVHYRSGRVARPVTALPVSVIRPKDGWCDDPADQRYNRPVRHPYRASAEHMWRGDRLYDLVVTLDHNSAPVVPGGGSAVFLHVARPDWGPTAGCVAFRIADLRWVVSRLTDAATIRVLAPQP